MHKHILKYFKLLILFCCITTKVFTQTNLVQNPSFEDYWSCPNGTSEMFKVKYWYNAGITPDYFNVCGQGGVTIPNTAAGYQNPASGNAFAGFFSFHNHPLGGKNANEFIGSALSNSLNIGTKYFVSIKVSPAFSQVSQINIFTNKLGVLFTKYKFDSTTINFKNVAQVYSNLIINDTNNWTSIKGSFIADSNYTYLHIGNLFDSSYVSVDSAITNQQGTVSYASYYFIDNVCVSTDSTFASNYLPTNMIKIDEKSNIINVFPNPCSDFLFITNINNVSSVQVLNNTTVIDVIKANQLEIVNNCAKISLKRYSEGIYIVHVKMMNNQNLYKKIIISKNK